MKAEGKEALAYQSKPLALARELDDAILHLRLNEEDIGTWVFRTRGDPGLVEAMDTFLREYQTDWLVREIILYLKRTLQRLDVSARSLITLIEPGSCFVGSLLELVLAADRSYMLDGTFEDNDLPAASLRLTQLNFGLLPMTNARTRLESRFPADQDRIAELQAHIGQDLDAETAAPLTAP